MTPSQLPFDSLPFSQRLRLIDQVLDEFILERLRADGGGIELMGLDGETVYLHYTGHCQGCSFALTTTLQFIRETFHRELSPNLQIELA